jgi:hypothetical protein
VSKFDVVIGNPPFSLAMQFIEKSMSLLKARGTLVFVLRTSFLESEARHEFWQQNPVTKLFTLSKRPSFTPDGKTDASSYSWFIWHKGAKRQEVKVI